MKTGSRQLVDQRPGCHHRIFSEFLVFVEPFDLREEAQGKVRCFDKSPGQILVVILGIALAFLLAVANSVKTLNRPCLQQDDGREYAANAENAVQPCIVRSISHPSLQTLFKEIDLRTKDENDREVASYIVRPQLRPLSENNISSARCARKYLGRPLV